VRRIATTTIVAIMLLSLMAGALAEDRTVKLDLQFTDLEPLDSGHYEGWLIIDGSPVSTGKFNVDANGDLVDLDGIPIDNFRVKGVDLEKATMFVLSIEPEGDNDATPAAIKPLAGELDADKETADLTANLGVDLTGISGKYILATPTNNFAPNDYDLELDFDGLPMLSTGHYEGWLVVDGNPVSTGKFNIDANGDIVDLDGNMIDSFTVTDLSIEDVEMFVLSIEPEGDNDAVPSDIKPLSGAVDSSGLGGSIAHTIGVDLSGADGTYILATPSNNDDYYLDLTFTDLPPLATGHYEGWLLIDGSPVSTGKFNIDMDGDIVDLDGEKMTMPFMVNDIDISMVSDFVLSVEPEGDMDDVPAAIKPLAGAVDGTGMGGDIMDTIGVDLTSASGEYILATPSNNDDYYLDLSFENLAPLASGHYEGWLIVDGSPVSTGKFNIDSEGNLLDHMTGEMLIMPFMVNDIDISQVTMFVLTIEDEGDDDAIPGDIKPLAGAVDGTGMAGEISPNIGVDLTGIGGEYILATPTNGADTNELSGIWYLNRSTGTPVAGLNLPDLTGTDWQYEGWVVIDGTSVTSGKFDMASGEDAFDGYSDVGMYPPFPGEDLLINAPAGVTFPTDLSGQKAVISIEPRMDNDPAPFQFKPLAADIPSDAVDHMEYMLDDMSSSLPTGMFSLSGAPSDELSGIWFLNRSTGTPVAGLDLPDLTGTDWTYEGWVVIDGTPVSSGTFDMPSGADGFDGYSASDMYPPFPGEDFLMNAPDGVTFPTDLSGQKAVISVEPRMDNDPSPVIFKPLAGMIPGDAMDHTEYMLDNVADMLPGGHFALSEAPSDENSGIWFLDLSSGSPDVGLDLPDLTGSDWQYEGWVVIDGTPVTSGKFDTASGFDAFDGYSASDMYPPFPGEDFLMNAPAGVTFPTDLSGQKAVISVEPRVDDDPAPFIFKPLAGMIPGDAMDHTNYGLDMMDLPTGSFMLTQHEAPPSNENSGIWFLDLSSGSPDVGLDLPDLTGTDWQYEGWVVIDGTPVTTGKFDMASGEDAFDGYSASDMYPPFPGEDFLMNAPAGVTFPTDLSGQKAVISIEPRMDNDPAPFLFKPLAGDIPATAQDHTVYDLMDQTSTLPTGTVTIKDITDSGNDSPFLGAFVAVAVLGLVAVAILTRRSGQ
jgi:hypothetical protein